jgi:hypothetical protein
MLLTTWQLVELKLSIVQIHGLGQQLILQELKELKVIQGIQDLRVQQEIQEPKVLQVLLQGLKVTQELKVTQVHKV